MADQPASSGKKRRVKNPETFRERASKASNDSEISKNAGRKSVAGRIARAIAWPFKKAASAIWNFRPLKFLHKPLRLIGKVIFPVYFRQSLKELKLVSWPTWRESRRLTSAVLVFAIVFGALIAGVDYGLDKLFRNILLK